MLNPPVNMYFSGWDRTTTPPQGGAGIHHPAGDVKKIATHAVVPRNGSTVRTNGPQANFWQIQWSATANGFSVTEGGSSGSPLFTNAGLIIGQLFGGDTINCYDPANDPGVYGKLSVSWNSSTDSRRRLSNWLDPTGTNAQSLAGRYACTADESVTYALAGRITIQVSNTIMASSTISTGAQVTFRAGNSIVLSPGFACTGNLVAAIGACGSPGNSSNRVAADITRAAQPVEEAGSTFTAYPNPAFSSVTFRYEVREAGRVRLVLKDFLGKEKIVAVDEKEHRPGTYEKSVSTSFLPAGMYYYILEANHKKETKKLMVLR